MRRLDVTAPGEGAAPVPPVDLANDPIVAVVDGGCAAASYAGAEAWRASPTFVGSADADVKHGNAVVSLIVNGHDWNNNRPLPKLNCRVGIVQAVAKRIHCPVRRDWPARLFGGGCANPAGNQGMEFFDEFAATRHGPCERSWRRSGRVRQVDACAACCVHR